MAIKFTLLTKVLRIFTIYGKSKPAMDLKQNKAEIFLKKSL